MGTKNPWAQQKLQLIWIKVVVCRIVVEQSQFLDQVTMKSKYYLCCMHEYFEAPIDICTHIYANMLKSKSYDICT